MTPVTLKCSFSKKLLYKHWLFSVIKTFGSFLSIFPTECEDGKYGLECSVDCGKCVNSTNCNHVGGECSLGCAPGWQNSDKCDTRKYEIISLYTI